MFNERWGVLYDGESRLGGFKRKRGYESGRLGIKNK